jgi:predicted Zn-dependent protease
MLSNQDEKALAVIKDLIPTASRDDFNTLVLQITQVYTQRKDLAGIVKLLKDANTIDPTNQNFVLWLAQAYVAVGDYNNAAFTINKLSTSNPEVVAQFNQQLNAYVDEMNKKQQSQATTTPVKKK